MIQFEGLTRRVLKAGTLGKAIVNAARAGRFKAPLHEESLIAVEYPVHPTSRYGYAVPRLEAVARILEDGRHAYEERLRGLLTLADDLARIPASLPPGETRAYWNNDWLGQLDAIVLYGMLARTRPATYIEIGSGYSTKFARLAIERHGLPTTLVSIDPDPRAEIDELSDECHRLPLESVDLSVFDRAKAGDIVFFDGSHCCFTNSDVTVFFLEVLPRLAPGTLVHVHDIFLPDDYPPPWSHRFYSEQYLLAAMLLAGSDLFEIVLPNHFCVTDRALSAIVAPLAARLGIGARLCDSTSFWLRIRERT